jgi:hypothetical protein
LKLRGAIDGDGAIGSDHLPAQNAEKVADFSGAIMLKLET